MQISKLYLIPIMAYICLYHVDDDLCLSHGDACLYWASYACPYPFLTNDACRLNEKWNVSPYPFRMSASYPCPCRVRSSWNCVYADPCLCSWSYPYLYWSYPWSCYDAWKKQLYKYLAQAKLVSSLHHLFSLRLTCPYL